MSRWGREDSKLLLPWRTALRPAHWVLAIFVVTAAFSVTHGTLVVDGWHAHDSEDKDFFDYDARNVHTWSDCFTKRGLWPGLYRPLSTNLYFHAGNAVFGPSLECYHAINITLMLISGVLLFRLSAFLLGPVWSLLPAALFMTRQAHVELPLAVSEAQILLATVLVLLGLCLFVAGRGAGRPALVWASLVPMLLAFLSKESILVVPLGLVFFGLLFDTRRHVRRYALVVGFAVLYGALLMAVLRPRVAGTDTTFAYDASPANVLQNVSATVLVFSNSLASPRDAMLFPRRVDALKLSLPIQATVVALAVLAVAFLLVNRRLRGCLIRELRVVAFGILLFLVSAAPYAVFANRMSMRYSYAPHLGLALAGGAAVRLLVHPLVSRVSRRWRGRHALDGGR